MTCIETIKEKIISDMIELYGKHQTEFKTKLKIITDVNKMIDSYTTIYVYIAPRKEVLQILGNFKTTKTIKDEDGNEQEKLIYTKKIIYNYQKKRHKEINESSFMGIYSELLEFCSLAEQLIMYKKIKEEEVEIKNLQSLSSNRIDKEKIRIFLG